MEEKGFLITHKKSQCSGCSACKNICPKKAIAMEEDEEGFLYPKVDNTKCINCNLCKKVCPYNKTIQQFKNKAFYYITKDEQQLLNSSSGGAFGDIVTAFFEKDNTIVYGCIFDDNLKAIHVGYEKLDDIDKFKKSKYVQSDLKNTFKEIRDYLNIGKRVLFSGTPCQISGLKSFLQKNYNNLFCVDIICHGVPSQKLLDYYIYNENKKNSSKVKSINFREKVKESDGNYNSRNIKMKFENNNSVIKSVKESSYLFGFHNHLFYRPSCYECNYCGINRNSDITIADCWGFENISNKYDIHKGISCVIINSFKGEELFNKMNGIKGKLSLDFVINNNSCYTIPTKHHKNRKKFFKGLNVNNFERKSFKYSHSSLSRRILKKIKNIIKKKIKNMLNSQSK